MKIEAKRGKFKLVSYTDESPCFIEIKHRNGFRNIHHEELKDLIYVATRMRALLKDREEIEILERFASDNPKKPHLTIVE